MRIYSSRNGQSWSTVSAEALTAPGNNNPRWYRASAIGDQLTFEYSDDGVTFTVVTSVTSTHHTTA